MTDQGLINLTVRTNLRLIAQLNRYPELEGMIFRKELLARGTITLQQKTVLTELERLNLQRFNEKWSIEMLDWN